MSEITNIDISSKFIETGFWTKCESEKSRRSAVQITCPSCNTNRVVTKKYIKKTLNRSGKYSLNCATCRRLKTLVKVPCSFCETEIERKIKDVKNSRSGLLFCNRKCKESAQKDFQNHNFDCIRPSHYIDGLSSYRNNLRWECVACKMNTKSLLRVHHIDGNHENNVPENLEVVCANHHAIRHLKFKDGDWVYSGKYLTPRELLEELDSVLCG